MVKRPDDKPNIVFILSDDQGGWAMGCAGNHEIRTPNLDRLAATGTRFENFFCSSPVCSPARASLLTGRIPSQHGIHDWLKSGNIGDEPIEYLAGQVGYTDILSQNGYVCGISGKWQLGDSLKIQKGFSHWYVHQKGGSSYHNAPMVRDGKPFIEPGYLTDAITDDALQFIHGASQGPQPFYLSVHYTAPHSPWIHEHPADLVSSYNDCPFTSCPQEPWHPEAVYRYREDTIRDCLKGYFAAVTAMDRSIGRIIDQIERLGLRGNTLIFFTSDNGFNCGHHGIWGKGNGTLSLNMYDTSVKVPAIASQPGFIPQQAVCPDLISGCDFMPTLLDYCGCKSHLPPDLPGRSFAAALRGKSWDERDYVTVYDEYGPVRMIRTKEWKYVHRYPYGPHELYDLRDDPGEKVNRIADDANNRLVISLRAELTDWFHRYVNPRFDGTHEAVRGNGQIYLVGPASQGRPAFDQDRRITDDPGFIPGVSDRSK